MLLLLDPPPAGSQAEKDELAQLHAIEQARTPEQASVADSDANDQTIFLFDSVFGKSFSEQNLPATAALGKRVKDVASANVRVAKDYFQRRRPYPAR